MTNAPTRPLDIQYGNFYIDPSCAAAPDVHNLIAWLEYHQHEHERLLQLCADKDARIRVLERTWGEDGGYGDSLPCPECRGKGEVAVIYASKGHPATRYDICRLCKGSGEAP